MEDQALPFLEKPHDSIRHGLVNLKGDASLKHPVELAQTSHRDTQETSRLRMLRDLYGVAAPAKQQIERSILSKFERLPGLPSSKLGLESLTGTLDDFSFDSFIGLAYESETPELPLHSVMETKLGMHLDRITRPII